MTSVELSMQHGMKQEIYNPIIQSMRLTFSISTNWASLIKDQDQSIPDMQCFINLLLLKRKIMERAHEANYLKCEF